MEYWVNMVNVVIFLLEENFVHMIGFLIDRTTGDGGISHHGNSASWSRFSTKFVHVNLIAEGAND